MGVLFRASELGAELAPLNAGLKSDTEIFEKYAIFITFVREQHGDCAKRFHAEMVADISF
jgi:hypothetical protein